MSTAFITGGASGMGKATAEMLVKKGIKVFIADRDEKGAKTTVAELNATGEMAEYAVVDVSKWDSLAKAFGQAVETFERIDYVYAIAGINERQWLTNDIGITGFQPPDLSVLDINLKGVLYTVALAVQQFRRQRPNGDGFRGKIGIVASVCGLYCCPTVPVYTAAKHALVGLVRSYGTYLPEEKITMNALCPSVVRTNMSTQAFYDNLESMGIMTPIEGITETFEKFLGANKTSGICYEIGPNYKTQGAVETFGRPYIDRESAILFDKLYERSRPLHAPRLENTTRTD